MMYTSTRDGGVSVPSAQAITRGISCDGGLFVPESLPVLRLEELQALTEKSYAERAEAVLSGFLTDFTREEVRACVRAAYTPEKFRTPAIAPLRELEPGVHMLELWHGPTCAFKDMALQILPHLMQVSVGKTAGGREIVILGRHLRRHGQGGAGGLPRRRPALVSSCFIRRTGSARCRSCR